MKEIIIASTNPAKIFQIKSALKLIGIEANGVDEILPEVEEDGKTLIENATKKALSAARFLNKIVLAMDNGLYFEGLKDEEQPGAKIRRIKGIEGRRPSDEELIEYYSKLIGSLGNWVKGSFRFGVCIATPDGKTWTTEAIESKRFFTNKACKERTVGYPIESLAINLKNGKYVAQMSEEEKENFWQETTGKALGEFVLSVEI